MLIAGLVSVCVQLYRMFVFHCLSLRVSAYMAIFKCVGVFVYLRSLLRCFFHVVTLCMFVICGMGKVI
jgi:hypothetical protein